MPRPSDRRLPGPRCYDAEPDPDGLRRQPAARQRQGRHRPHDRDRRRLQHPYLASGPGDLRPGLRSSGRRLHQHRAVPGAPAVRPAPTTTRSAGPRRRTLDVLWAHAIAPGAKIVLPWRRATTTPTSSTPASTSWTTTSATSSRRASARPRHAWTRPCCARARDVRRRPSSKGMTVFASSGDSRRRPVQLRRQRRRPGRQHPGVRPARHRRRRHHAQRGHLTRRLPGRDRVDRAVFGCNPPAVDRPTSTAAAVASARSSRRPAFQNAMVKGTRLAASRTSPTTPASTAAY